MYNNDIKGFFMLKNLFPQKNTSEIARAELEKVSKAFELEFPQGELTFKWDARFNTVLAEFEAVHQEKVLSILGKSFTDYWYNACITDAPASIRNINTFLGGLKPGQLFFSTDTTAGTFAYCAWWPWNMGKMISIRLALSSDSVDQEPKNPYIEDCKRWFNVANADQWGAV